MSVLRYLLVTLSPDTGILNIISNDPSYSLDGSFGKLIVGNSLALDNGGASSYFCSSIGSIREDGEGSLAYLWDLGCMTSY